MIDWTYSEGVYELTLARPPCNEIGTAMLADLRRFLDQVDRDAHTLILRSGLRQGFCAGADLRELYRGLSDAPKDQHGPQIRQFIDAIHGVMDDLDMLPLTTVGVVHGVCFGGGFELALTCDVLIAEKTARFCFPELRLGIIPGFGGIPRLRRDVGNGLIRDLLLSGRSINAKKALAAGLVSQVLASGEGITAARARGPDRQVRQDRARGRQGLHQEAPEGRAARRARAVRPPRRGPGAAGRPQALRRVHRPETVPAMSTSLDTLIRLAAKRFGADPAQLRAEDDLFERLGIDSFQAVELISDVEDEFDVELPDYELQGIKTFAALAQKIDARR
ncbi:enoyl-CoA hydratase-related protein [Nannocystis pusilla]|uniref:Enoyl-CoA hydratase-related protein n=2 Tax=Nannocystaceae TaxID=224463 RepID=A0A9X3EL56_9BACT|nr:enoyl-CoA hydratase-related protein [Nannocystis pusilla]MCY1005199.1 enoyl-CoA hydratase-related protein [Nannocystis pusilla]